MIEAVQSKIPKRSIKGLSMRVVKENLTAYSMILPALFFFVMFLVIPLGIGIRISFYNYSGVGPINDFTGFDNFIKSIGDKMLFGSIFITLKLVVVNVVVSTTIGFILAYCLFKRIWGYRFFSVALYIPSLVTVTVSALLWRQMLEPNSGMINTVLRGVGLDNLAKAWLNDPGYAMAAGIVATVWKEIPFVMLVLYASLLSIPLDMLEAATIDGANEWQKITRIIYPYLIPVISILAILIIADGFRGFGMIYVLTEGGPANATQISTIYIFKQAAIWNNYGYANAIAFEIFILVGSAVGLLATSFKKLGIME